MQMFKSPKESLGDLGAQSAAKLIAAATDVAVVVDGQGIIRDVAFNKEELSLELDGHGRWLGSKFQEIVTPETRDKVVELLRDAAARKSSGWRQVNHASPAGADIPVLYAAIDIGREAADAALRLVIKNTRHHQTETAKGIIPASPKIRR